MFNKITAAVLFVQDFENCLEFYRDKLGLPVAVQEPDFAAFKMNDQDFAIQGLATSAQMINVDVKAFAARGPGLSRVLLCTRVEDVDAAYETLKARGVAFTLPPTNQPWGLRTAHFLDPEGNIWEIAQPVDETVK
ncbi:MAG: VOC family protein [Anaerolineae bacterium]|nr:VOC family protein [Anaerolineae bacterium]